MMVSSPVRTKSAWALATFFGAGYFPKGPGTAGSVAAIVIAWPLVAAGFTNTGFALLAVAVLFPAIWSASVVAREFGLQNPQSKDPQIVVVDEVIGQWLTLGGAIRLNWRSLLIGLALFRFFDILKPPPIRSLERFPGGVGIVLDDVMAGLYGAFVLFALGYFRLY